MISFNDTSDNDLVVLLNQGNERAFMEIYHRYKTPLANNLLRILKSPELVEEVLQDIFLMLWEKRRQIDSKQKVSAYLYKATLNKTKNIFRQLAYDQRAREEFLKNYIHAGENTVQTWMDDKEMKLLVNSLLDHLPAQQRKVYVLCKLDGLSYKEVSNLLNISEATVNSHIRNANKLLRNQINRQRDLSSIVYLGIFILLLAG